MHNRCKHILSDYISEYSERNTDNKYKPVAVGRFGIRSRESIYSKELANDYSKNKVIFQGTLTVGMGSKQIDIGIISDNSIYSVSPAYHTYKITNINYDYLRYYLECRNQDMFIRYSKRGSRQGKTIDLKQWLNYKIYTHDKNDQESIVNILDSVSKMMQLKKELLEKLDSLVKSRFIEMFVNKGYPYEELINVSHNSGDYGAASSSTEFDLSRPRYVRITDINDDGTLNNDFVSSIEIADDQEYMLSYGDFLFARMGATVGKTYAYSSGNQIFAGYLIRYKLDIAKINPIYLFWYTKSEDYNEWVKLHQSGAAQPGINAKKYSRLPILIAPILYQNQFADFVAQVDKSKFEVKQSLEKLETLKKSLMQEYFGE